jgi:hypothetical protein
MREKAGIVYDKGKGWPPKIYLEHRKLAKTVPERKIKGDRHV